MLRNNTNAYVGQGLDLLRDGLQPYVESELQSFYGDAWQARVKALLADSRLANGAEDPLHDTAVLLAIVNRTWGDIFRHRLRKMHRTLVNELIDVRNRWAHQEGFSADDAYRAVDSIERLLTAISAPQLTAVQTVKTKLKRLVFDASTLIATRPDANAQPAERLSSKQPETFDRGHYLVGEPIGRGAMSRVHAGKDTRLRRPVAIKILRETLSEDPTFVQRFFDEAASVASLSHDNIVRVYDAGRERDLPYIVMELVSGTDLAKLLREERSLPEATVIDYAAQVANALAYAHAHGQLHRDLKPSNILVTDTDVVKVCDFLIGGAASGDYVSRSGYIWGTVPYVSPEQVQGHRLDGRSDLYSLGVVIYEMLTGAKPFEGEAAAVLNAHVHVPAPPVDAKASVSPALTAIVARLLEKDAAARFNSATELAVALRAAPTSTATVPVDAAAPAECAGDAFADAPTVTSRAVPSRTNPGSAPVRVPRRGLAAGAVLAAAAVTLLVFRLPLQGFVPHGAPAAAPQGAARVAALTPAPRVNPSPAHAHARIAAGRPNGPEPAHRGPQASAAGQQRATQRRAAPVTYEQVEVVPSASVPVALRAEPLPAFVARPARTAIPPANGRYRVEAARNDPSPERRPSAHLANTVKPDGEGPEPTDAQRETRAIRNGAASVPGTVPASALVVPSRTTVAVAAATPPPATPAALPPPTPTPVPGTPVATPLAPTPSPRAKPLLLTPAPRPSPTPKLTLESLRTYRYSLSTISSEPHFGGETEHGVPGQTIEVATDESGRVARVTSLRNGRKLGETLLHYAADSRWAYAADLSDATQQRSRVRYQRDERGYRTREDVFALDGTPSSYTLYNRTGNTVSVTVHAPNGQVTNRFVKVYAANGIVVSERWYPSEADNFYEFVYDQANGHIVSKRKVTNGEVQVTYQLRYDPDGDLTREDYYDRFGVPYGFSEFADRLLVRKFYHFRSGETRESRIAYTSRRWPSETKFFVNGQLICTFTYELGPTGRLIKSTALGPSRELWAEYPNYLAQEVNRDGTALDGRSSVIYRDGMWW